MRRHQFLWGAQPLFHHAYMLHVCEFLLMQNIITIDKKLMSEELTYIVNGKKSNGNKCKNLLGKNERIGLRKK